VIGNDDGRSKEKVWSSGGRSPAKDVVL